MMGLEMADARMGMALSPLLAQNGVLAVFADHRPSTLQLMPPLIIQPDEVDFVLEALDRALTFLEAHPELLEMVAALSGALGR